MYEDFLLLKFTAHVSCVGIKAFLISSWCAIAVSLPFDSVVPNFVLLPFKLPLSPVYTYLEEFAPSLLNPNLKRSPLHLQSCKATLPPFPLGKSILTQQFTEYHPTVKESKAPRWRYWHGHVDPRAVFVPVWTLIFFFLGGLRRVTLAAPRAL